MRLPDQRLPRDWLVLLTWLATTACLALQGPFARFGHRRPPRLRRSATIVRNADAPDPAAELTRLHDSGKRGVWRCDTLYAMHDGAADAIEAAEDDFEHMLAQCAAVMTLPPRGLVLDERPETEFVFLPIAA